MSTPPPPLVPPDAVITVFGGNGDLARRKLLPSFWELFRHGLMPRRWALVGTSRSSMADDDFVELARDGIERFGDGVDDDRRFEEFSRHLRYRGGFGPDEPDRLRRALAEAEADVGGSPTRLFYLSVPPGAFGPITRGIGRCGFGDGARVVFEKPFGSDPASFAELDATVREVLAEEQIYRIDHFLGKEALQNVMALRFANGMFEPVWNRQHIDHIQIDSPESIGIGTRASFYEGTGAMRDMLVTHLFQVLSVIALEPPTALHPKALMDEKAKVFESMAPLRPEDVVYGQYASYRDEDGVAVDSTTETFVAARVEIDSWRWAGVPIYLRTGKQMADKRSTVTLAFNRPPRHMFPDTVLADGVQDHLTLEMSGREGFSLAFLAKKPGPRLELQPASMRFSYERSDIAGPGVEAAGRPLDAYSRLLHDALTGDRTLFTRADGIGRTWDLVAPLLAAPPRLHGYDDGSWGPDAATDLIAPRTWHLPETHGH